MCKIGCTQCGTPPNVSIQKLRDKDILELSRFAYIMNPTAFASKLKAYGLDFVHDTAEENLQSLADLHKKGNGKKMEFSNNSDNGSKVFDYHEIVLTGIRFPKNPNQRNKITLV